MPGRRWSDGLHQSIEAKEGVAIRKEDQTLATITFQNYFRLYKKLSGMTGTAETEAAEFEKIYKLEIVVIPTNKPHAAHRELRRGLTAPTKEKYMAVADEIAELHEKKQPVLVGTTSIEKIRAALRHSQAQGRPPRRAQRQVPRAGSRDRRAGRPSRHGHHRHQHGRPRHRHSARRQCRVHGPPGAGEEEAARAPSASPRAPSIPWRRPGFLRFYYHGQEFEVAEPDWDAAYHSRTPKPRKEEHEQVIDAGGLYILGTERHESRRIDNQLRGRAGRQGDPGASRFYLSLEDDLMRIFAKQWVSTLLERLGMEEGVPIESRMISKRIEGAQKAVEAQNFESRKHLLEYDDVMNKQREAVYGLRRQLLEGVDQRELILEDYVGGILSSILDEFAGEKVHPDQWNMKGTRRQAHRPLRHSS